MKTAILLISILLLNYSFADNSNKDKIYIYERAAKDAEWNENYQLAAQNYEKLLEIDKDKLIIAMRLARIYKVYLKDIKKAVTAYNRALETAKKQANPIKESDIHYNLARCYGLLKNTDKRDEHDLKAIELIKNEDDKKEMEGSIYYDRAMTLVHQENYLAALKEFQKANGVYESQNPDLRDNEELFYIKYHIAIIYNRMANYEEAKKILLDNLKFCETEFGKNHRFSGHICILLSSVYHSELYFDTAESYINRAIKIFRKQNNMDRYVANGIQHLASINQRKGNYEKAISLYNEGLELFKKINDDDNIAKTQVYIAETFVEQGQFEKAKTMLTESLDDPLISRESFFKARIHLNLAKIYGILNKNKMALQEIESAEKIVLKIYGKDNKNMAFVYHSFQKYYFDNKDYQKSLDYLEKAVLLNYPDNKKFLPHKIEKPKFNNSFASLYIEMKKLDKAFPYLKQALKDYEKIYGSHHLYTAGVYYHAGQYFFQKKSYPKAKQYLKKSVSVYINRNIYIDQAKDAFKLLSETYKQLGDNKKAREYLDKIAAEKKFE